MSIRDLSDYLGISVSTLYVWRSTGDGPPSFKVGRSVRYRAGDIERWLRERKGYASDELLAGKLQSVARQEPRSEPVGVMPDAERVREEGAASVAPTSTSTEAPSAQLGERQPDGSTP
jgi:predicted DNA-binding transcriptional regulator AlpA